MLEMLFPLSAVVALIWNVIYVALGFVILALLAIYINLSNAAGQEFTLHGALDKIHNDPNSRMPLAVLLAGVFLSLAVLVASFVRG